MYVKQYWRSIRFHIKLDDSKKLDEYIKELLSDNKKLSTLNQEKTLKGTQGKLASFLSPDFEISWKTLFFQALSDNDDEATLGHMEIAALFEQTIQLIGQALNAITYHRR